MPIENDLTRSSFVSYNGLNMYIKPEVERSHRHNPMATDNI